MAARKDITSVKLRDELRALIRTGEIRQSEHAKLWAKNPIHFIEKRNIKITEKIEELILAMIDPEIETLAVAGPRGGGKTLIVSIVAGALWAFDEYDVLHMGGSEFQAKYGYGYLTNYYFSDPSFQAEFKDAYKTLATGRRGNWYIIGACSETFVRGPHPGDPHIEMGNIEHGGILIIDEEAVAKAPVVEAALPVVGDANPSKTIRMSTNHEEANTFARIIDDPIGYGVDKVIEFDAFDISEKCADKCASCIPQFAGHRNPFAYKQMLSDMGKEHAGADLPRGYCEGKAKKHRPGHKRIRRLKADYKKLGKEGFEKEYTRNKNKSTGKIIPRAWLDKCLTGQNRMIPPIYGRPTALVCDHSPGFTAYMVLQMQDDFRVAVLDVEHLIAEQSDDRIVSLAKAMITRNGVNFGFGDAAERWTLSRISRESGILIKPFQFLESTKRDSIGMVKRLFEDTRIMFPGLRKGKVYFFPKPAFRVAFEQLANWHRDKKGKVVKKEDDYPDSMCTGAKAFITGSYNATAAVVPQTPQRGNRLNMPHIADPSGPDSADQGFGPLPGFME